MLQTAVCLATLAALATTAAAQTEQTVKVGTSTLSGFVTDVVLNGNNVVLKMENQGAKTYSLLSTHIDLKYDETGISTVEAERPTAPEIYDLQGRRVHTDVDALPRGIYIVDGKKRIVR